MIRKIQPLNKFFTIKMRLTLSFICILALVLITFSSILYINLRQNLYNEINKHLQIQAREILFTYQKNTLSSTETLLTNLSKTTGEIIPASFKSGFYKKNKRLIEGNNASQIIPQNILNPEQNEFFVSSIDNQDWAILTLPVKNEGKFIGWFRLAYNLQKEQSALKNLLFFLLLSIPLTLLLASGGGYYLAAKALKPIDDITRTAQMISSSNLSQRIKKKDTDDEVGRLTKTLNHLLNRLEQAFNREKRFTADASHELRTPISVIKAHTEKGLNKPHSIEEYQQILKTIHKKTDYMNHLVEQLLLLARSNTDPEFLNKEKLNLSELIEIVIAEMREKARATNIIIRTEVKENLKIYGDQSMLVALLINLIDNAIKYTPPDGEVIISARPKNNQIQLIVSDPGIGISKKDQKHIFESFYRVDKSRSRKSGSTGLGLAICKRIVETHGGKIRTNSNINKGTTFYIYLPEL